MIDQLTFNFSSGGDVISSGSPAARPAARGAERGRKQRMQRALLAWLISDRQPQAAAFNVPTRITRFKADVAAMWCQPVRNSGEEGPRNILVPARTVIIQCHTDREDCWADVTRSSEILPRLQAARERREAAEAQIRREEPELRDPDSLFEEYAEWHYDRTSNREYHKLLREISKLEGALFEGTRFEQIRSAEVADNLYLAVPSGLVHAHELADGWGLIWIGPDLAVSVEKEAEDRDCVVANRLHLVQNIAAAATEDVLFAKGVRRRADGSAYLTQAPRGHRRKKRFRL
jgi:hypothetical protein